VRTAFGVIIALLMLFPGIVLLQWFVGAFGLYDSMTLTDGCLVMIMVLLSVNLMHMRRTQSRPASRPRTQAEDTRETAMPRLRYLPGQKGPSERAQGHPRSRRRPPQK